MKRQTVQSILYWIFVAFIALLVISLFAGLSHAQTHTFCPTDGGSTGTCSYTATQDFSGTLLMKLRVAAGLTSSVPGDCGFDSTNENYHCWNGADGIIPLVLASGLPTNGQVAVFSVAAGEIELAGSASALPVSISAVSHNFLTSYTSGTGNFTQAQPACSDLSNAAASCSTDATNASNISSGTLAAARMNPSVSAHTYLGNNTGGSTAASFVQPTCSDLSNAANSCSTDTTIATNIVSGTLAAARVASTLNATAFSGNVTVNAGNNLNAGRVVASGNAIASCSATGIGSTGTCGALGGTDSIGGITLTVAGTGAAASGTFTVNFSAALGSTRTLCGAFPYNFSSGTWNARVSFIQTSASTTLATFNWDNNGVGLTNGSTVYAVNILCWGT